MAELPLPPGGQSIRALLNWKAGERLRPYIANFEGPLLPPTDELLRSLESDLARHAYVFAFESWEDLAGRCATEKVVAWGTPDDQPDRDGYLPAAAWLGAACSDLASSRVSLADGRSYIGVKYVETCHLDEWRKGVTVGRAFELIDPFAARLFQTGKYRVLFGTEPPPQEWVKGREAHRDLSESLLTLIKEGKVSLCAFRPPGDPSGSWTPVSDAVRDGLDRDALDPDESILDLDFTGKLPVRIFWRPQEGHERAKKLPVKTRVADALSDLGPAPPEDLDKHGAKRDLARKIQKE